MIPPVLLVALANRCLIEPPSRALDSEIYCAVNRITDGNDLSNDTLVDARRNGDVLVAAAGAEGWVAAPAFTRELGSARSLVPDGLYTISKVARIVCATALTALAITQAPPRQQGFLGAP